MHKTYLNETELQVIKNADEIVEKIGGFPSVENSHLTSVSAERISDDPTQDGIRIELVFDLSGWLDCLDMYYEACQKPWYYHKDFSERNLRIRFSCANHIDVSFSDSSTGEIYFGGEAQEKGKNRDLSRDFAPGGFNTHPIARPFTCFYLYQNPLTILFDEKECEITAELF